MTVQVESPDRVALDHLPGEFSDAGLVILLHVETQAALVFLPEASGIVPPWSAAPDATGQSKLSTLAQELGMLVLPDDCPADRFEWFRVPNLGDALRAAGVAEDAAMIPMPVTTTDGRRAAVRLIWPASKPEAVARAAATAAGAAKAAATKPDSSPSVRQVGLQELPVYSRSLLRVKVPVVVTLAQKRQPVSRIVELGPGCIIQFDKSCEEMLDLSLGGRMIANGEAVKVGDKFGLRITSIVLPEERFHPLKKA
jgi:flagellar motor switch/type III secretory pathway protein FliN